MHHIHISTEALFVMLGFVALLTCFMIWAVTSRKNTRQKLENERYEMDHRPSVVYRDRYVPVANGGVGEGAPAAPMAGPSPSYGGGYRSSSGGYSAPAAPVYVHSGGNDGMLTGVLLGSMLSGGGHHDTTVIRETSPAPAPTPSYDNSSSDSSSGGIDISWGGDNGGSSSSSYDSGGSSIDVGGSGGFDSSSD